MLQKMIIFVEDKGKLLLRLVCFLKTALLLKNIVKPKQNKDLYTNQR